MMQGILIDDSFFLLFWIMTQDILIDSGFYVMSRMMI